MPKATDLTKTEYFDEKNPLVGFNTQVNNVILALGFYKNSCKPVIIPTDLTPVVTEPSKDVLNTTIDATFNSFGNMTII